MSLDSQQTTILVSSGITETEERRMKLREYDRLRQRNLRAKRGPTVAKRFCGVDGEGGNINGKHLYLLLRAGEFAIENPAGITWQEALDFLCELPKDRIYVSYFFDYDVTMILRGCREERVRRLLARELRTNPANNMCLPVDLDGYQIDYLPRKEFKVRRSRNDKWTVISDTGSFFQSAFIKTLELWEIGTVDQRESIATGKEQRSDFEAITDETRFYNQLEIDLLEELMTQFRAVCQDVGYVPSKWQGPGCMASVMFRKHGVPNRKSIPITRNWDLMESANAAYYGGRFETSLCGPVNGPIYQYDINSAYPSAITTLPCLLHGDWKYTGEPDPDSLYLAKGGFSATSDASFYGFPMRRKDGTIFFPRQGNGWYWSHEIKSARHQTFTINGAWEYQKRCQCVPFDWLGPIYAERQRIGKTAKGRVLKLALNSLYGKVAQSIGAASYANPVWAGLITSQTRALLLDAICDSVTHEIGKCGTDVLMLATDGVFTTNPRNLPTGKELGEWDESEHGSIFLIQPGLYFVGNGEGVLPKTRGVPLRQVMEKEQAFRMAWENGVQSETVSVNNFIGLRQAIHRNAFESAGSWHRIEKKVSFDISSKRNPENNNLPYPGSPTLESVPYAKSIGKWREARIDMLDQPDWADGLFGEDWS